MATIIGFGFEIFAQDRASREIDRVTSAYDAATDALGDMGRQSERTGKQVEDSTQRQLGSINQLNTFVLRGASIFRRLQFSLQNFSDRTFGSLENAVMQASTLESQMMGVTRTTGLTGKTLRKLEDRLLTMSDTLPLSALELGKVAVIAGQLGVAAGKGGDQAVEAISKLAFTAAQAARTFGMSEFGAARALAQLSNVFQEDINNADALASVVSRLSATTVATADEIINAATRMGALTRSMGASTSEALAWSAAIRQVGGRARQGATAISQLFTQSQMKAAKFAAQMGLTTAEFQDRFRKDATGTLLDFLDSMKSVEKTKLPSVLKDLGLSGRAAQAILLPMIQMTDQIRNSMAEADQTMRAASSSTSELTRQFGTMTQGLGPAIATLRGSIQNLVIRAGRPLLGIATMLVNVLTQIVAIIGMIPSPILTAGVVMAGLAAGMAALGAVLAGVIASGFLFISMGLTWLGTFIMLNSKMGDFTLGISGLYDTLNKGLQWFANYWFGSWAAMTRTFEGWAYTVRLKGIDALSSLKSGWKSLHGYLTTVKFKDVFTGIFTAIQNGAKFAASKVMDLYLWMQTLTWASVTAAIADGFWAVVIAIQGATVATWEWAVALGVTGILYILLAVAAAIGVIWLAWKALVVVWDASVALLGGLWDGIKTGLSLIWSALSAIGRAIWEFFAAPVRTVYTIISDIVGVLSGEMGELWGEMGALISEVWGAVSGLFSEIWGLMSQLVFGTGAWANTWKEIINLWKNVGLPFFKVMVSAVMTFKRVIEGSIFALGFAFGFLTEKIKMLREDLGRGVLSRFFPSAMAGGGTGGQILLKKLVTERGGGPLGLLASIASQTVTGGLKGGGGPVDVGAGWTGSLLNLAGSMLRPVEESPVAALAGRVGGAPSITTPALPSAGSPSDMPGAGSPVQTSARNITTPKVQLGDVVVPITVQVDGRELFSTVKRVSMEQAARAFGLQPVTGRGAN